MIDTIHSQQPVRTAAELELKAMIGEQNGKIDPILRSITGLGNL